MPGWIHQIWRKHVIAYDSTSQLPVRPSSYPTLRTPLSRRLQVVVAQKADLAIGNNMTTTNHRYSCTMYLVDEPLIEILFIRALNKENDTLLVAVSITTNDDCVFTKLWTCIKLLKACKHGTRQLWICAWGKRCALDSAPESVQQAVTRFLNLINEVLLHVSFDHTKVHLACCFLQVQVLPDEHGYVSRISR